MPTLPTIPQTSSDPSQAQLKEGKHTNSTTQKIKIKKIITGVNNYWSLISLNINGLNSAIKRHRLRNWIRKQDPTFCCLQETHLNHKDRHYLRVNDWEKVF